VATDSIRGTVLDVRASKGMLEDPHRYEGQWMQGTRRTKNVEDALAALSHVNADGSWDRNRCSCGSFFMNPVLTQEQASSLPTQAPRFPAPLSDGSTGVKTSAAWLIDHAGFRKGFALSADARAALSSVHTLALTNRGGASAAEVLALAVQVRNGVQRKFGVTLLPEPVLVGDIAV
jgi:UDP-N-acetylmuramate dehydrogenase